MCMATLEYFMCILKFLGYFCRQSLVRTVAPLLTPKSRLLPGKLMVLISEFTVNSDIVVARHKGAFNHQRRDKIVASNDNTIGIREHGHEAEITLQECFASLHDQKFVEERNDEFSLLLRKIILANGAGETAQLVISLVLAKKKSLFLEVVEGFLLTFGLEYGIEPAFGLNLQSRVPRLTFAKTGGASNADAPDKTQDFSFLGKELGCSH
jgi:hypothetical protein